MTTTPLIGGELGDYLATEIPRAARAAHRRFPRIDTEDFEQEMWEAVLNEIGRYRVFWEAQQKDVIWAELKRVATVLGVEDDRDRRARKAAAAGYRSIDEEFYNHRVLAVAIETLIEAEWEPAVAVERASQATDNAGMRVSKSNTDNATELLEVTLIDVNEAFQKLSGAFQRVLIDYYSLDQGDTVDARWERERKANSMGLTVNAFRQRAYYALDALQHELGGPSPYIRRLRRRPPRKTA